MVTIKSEIKTSGKSLMKNKLCDVVIKPSQSGKIRIFSKGAEVGFDANIDNLYSTDHCVTLCSKEHRTLLGDYKYKAMLCEHFMAACAICKIDSIDVYLSETEFPIFDGSAKVWVEKFNEVGFIGEEAPVEPLKETYSFVHNNSLIVLSPQEEKTTITYAVNFNHPDLKNRWVNLNQDKNLDEIIEARTFGYLKDLETFQKMGYSKGVTIDNTVGLTDDGGYTTTLRSEFEPAKHKILDIIGDLYLTGINPLKLNANIMVKEAGHALHVQFAKTIEKNLI